MKPISQLKWFKKQTTAKGVLTMLDKLYESEGRHLKRALFDRHTETGMAATKCCAVGGCVLFAASWDVERAAVQKLSAVCADSVPNVNNGPDGYRRIRTAIKRALKAAA